MSHPNLVQSVRDRLLKRAKEQQEEFQNFLMRYALERWLYRLSLSPYCERFVLKGAMLFAIWSEQPHRPTQDLDLLGFGSSSIQELEAACRDICAVVAEEDGLTFLTETVKGRAIREENICDGVRLTLRAMLGKATIPLQIDIGFGDAITPEPELISYPVILDLPAPQLRAYVRETVIAEKFNAMVELGFRNTRYKDFYDLWVLARTFDFDGRALSEAITATFSRRRTPIPTEIPIALTTDFSEAPLKKTQWQAFLRRAKLMEEDVSLDEIVSHLREFLLPLVEAAQRGSHYNKKWTKQRKWE